MNKKILLKRYLYLTQILHETAHDFKSPLRVLSYILKEIENKGNQEVSHTLIESFQASLTRMNTMVAILMTQMEEETLSPLYYQCHPDDIFNTIQQFYGVELQKRNATLTIEGPFPLLRVPSPVIENIFYNLFENAVTHHKEHSFCLKVSCSMEADFIHFYVEDQRRDLASPQTPDSSSNESKKCCHSGWGLFLCQNMLNKIRGRLSITSSPNLPQSCTVTVSLPRELVCSACEC